MSRYSPSSIRIDPVRVPVDDDEEPGQPLKKSPMMDPKTGFDARDQPKMVVTGTAPRPASSEISEPLLVKAQRRLQLLAQKLQEHWLYLQALHIHLQPWGLQLPSLPQAPSFGPILAGKKRGNLTERFARVERHVAALETTLEQHWTYLQRLEAYLGSKPNATQILRESSSVSLFFPQGSVDERVAWIEKLLEKLEASQKQQRAFLKSTDALFRPK